MYALTEQEQTMIEHTIFLPLARRVLKNDQKAIQDSRVKFGDIYVRLIERAEMSMAEDLKNLRKRAREQNRQIIQREDELHYEVIVRGYHHNMGYHPNIAAEKTKKLLTKYLHTQH